MLTRRFLLGRGREALSEQDSLVLEQSITTVRSVPARHPLTRRGDMVNASCMLLEGFVCRYLDDREGFRQLVSIHVPGDFVDLHGLLLRRLDHDIVTLGPCTLAFYDHDVLMTVVDAHPRLARWLWYSSMLDAAIHREWIFRMGRLGADGRVAHFFCELNARLEFVDLAKNGRFTLPATQADIAEACGITGVHVNRVLRQMRERGLLNFRSGEVEIADLPGLTALAEFDPLYLYRGTADWMTKATDEPAALTATG